MHQQAGGVRGKQGGISTVSQVPCGLAELNILVGSKAQGHSHLCVTCAGGD